LPITLIDAFLEQHMFLLPVMAVNKHEFNNFLCKLINKKRFSSMTFVYPTHRSPFAFAFLMVKLKRFDLQKNKKISPLFIKID
jgi:hypothetical protein